MQAKTSDLTASGFFQLGDSATGADPSAPAPKRSRRATQRRRAATAAAAAAARHAECHIQETKALKDREDEEAETVADTVPVGSDGDGETDAPSRRCLSVSMHADDLATVVRASCSDAGGSDGVSSDSDAVHDGVTRSDIMLPTDTAPSSTPFRTTIVDAPSDVNRQHHAPTALDRANEFETIDDRVPLTLEHSHLHCPTLAPTPVPCHGAVLALCAPEEGAQQSVPPPCALLTTYAAEMGLDRGADAATWDASVTEALNAHLEGKRGRSPDVVVFSRSAESGALCVRYFGAGSVVWSLTRHHVVAASRKAGCFAFEWPGRRRVTRHGPVDDMVDLVGSVPWGRVGVVVDLDGHRDSASRASAMGALVPLLPSGAVYACARDVTVPDAVRSLGTIHAYERLFVIERH